MDQGSTSHDRTGCEGDGVGEVDLEAAGKEVGEVEEEVDAEAEEPDKADSDSEAASDLQTYGANGSEDEEDDECGGEGEGLEEYLGYESDEDARDAYGERLEDEEPGFERVTEGYGVPGGEVNVRIEKPADRSLVSTYELKDDSWLHCIPSGSKLAPTTNECWGQGWEPEEETVDQFSGKESEMPTTPALTRFSPDIRPTENKPPSINTAKIVRGNLPTMRPRPSTIST